MSKLTLSKQRNFRILLLCGFLIGGGLLGMFFYFRMANFLKTSDYFKIKEVEVNIGKRIPEGFKEKSIFSSELKDLLIEFKKGHPEYKDVVLEKIYPHRIRLKIIPRLPLFQIKLNGDFYLVDESSMIISEPSRKPYASHILVSGLFKELLLPRKGKRVSIRYFENIKELIKDIKSLGLDRFGKISSIYAYDLNGIKFFLGGLEILVGSDDYFNKLKKLRDLIFPRFKDLDKIKYIDLRFKDPTVGYKK